MDSLADQIRLRRAERFETKQSCYSVKSGIPEIIIKDGRSKSWSFPWAQRVFSSRLAEGEEEQFILTFVSHVVMITGSNLDKLEEDLAYHRVEKLRCVPAHFAGKLNVSPVVSGIVVTARDDK